MTETPRDHVDTVVDAFESEWRAARRPDIGSFLSRAADADRPAVLRELVRLDLEYRVRAGEAARVEHCLGRFPELAAEPADAVDLIALEYRVRADCGERVAVAEYLERFPALRDRLPPVLEPLRRGPAEVPGYELLGELGRGGMGVVYKARHLRLNRLVALKMILAGGHAGPPERDRLRAEAEAIARLHHPGVVQVYEAGECDGLPFVALELCPGGSLDRRLASGPLPPADAARLVAGVARGVQAAHDARVLHRDLKPANVLLAADGAPKVTDFGLAMCLDASVRTGSGGIVGTPSYMAPEQADGRGRATAASDVYAVGAILYECLTGRPPFRAATAVDTLRQVLADEPVPPRRLNPAVPRDLETVCLKCLDKSPARRYPTAAEVGDDLTRFLGRRPILARPVGPLARGWRWCQRQPAVALSLAATAAVLVAAAVVSTLFGLQAVADRKLAETNAGIAAREVERSGDILDRTMAADERMFWTVEREMISEGTLDAHSRRAVQEAAERFQRLIDRNSDRPEVRHRNGLAHLRLGEAHYLLNEYPQGIARLRTAIGVFEDLVAAHPDATAYRASLAEAISSAGYQIFYEREPDLETNRREANELCERAVALWDEVARSDPRAEHLDQQAAANYRLAVIARDQKQAALARAAIARSRKDDARAGEAVAEGEREDARARAAFAVARSRQGQALAQAPSDPKRRSELARLCGSMSNYFYFGGDLEGAREAAEAVVSTLRDMVGKADGDPRDEEEWYLAHRILIDVARRTGHAGRVKELVVAVLPAAERLAEGNPRNDLYARQLIGLRLDLLGTQSDSLDVIDTTTKVIARLAPLYRGAKSPQYRDWFALLDCHSKRAQALAELNRLDEALRDHDEGIALVRAWPTANKRQQPDYLRERYRDRARWEMTLGRYREAARDADTAATFAPPTDAGQDRRSAAEARARDAAAVAEAVPAK